MDEEIGCFYGKMWQLMTSYKQLFANENDNISWWDFAEYASKSTAYQRLLSIGLTRSLVACVAHIGLIPQLLAQCQKVKGFRTEGQKICVGLADDEHLVKHQNHAPFARHGSVFSGSKYYRYACSARFCLEPAAHVIAIYIRHHNDQHYEVRRLVANNQQLSR